MSELRFQVQPWSEPLIYFSCGAAAPASK